MNNSSNSGNNRNNWALIKSEVVEEECNGLGREVERVVRADPLGVLDDEELERICAPHCQRILEEAESTARRAVEEEIAIRGDANEREAREDLISQRIADIKDSVKVTVINAASGEIITEEIVSDIWTDFGTPESESLESSEFSESDPIIRVVTSFPESDCTDMDESDLLEYDEYDCFWDDCRKHIQLTVRPPYHEFYDCREGLLGLLEKHAESPNHIAELLSNLHAMRDYTRNRATGGFCKLTDIILAATKPPTLTLKRKRISSSGSGSDSGSGSYETGNLSETNEEDITEDTDPASKKRRIAVESTNFCNII